MVSIRADRIDSTDVYHLENGQLRVTVAPGVGGRIVQVRHLDSGHDFLWTNSRLPLARQAPGTAYDPQFYGGIDELLPSDLAESFGGIASPDHGELWTTALSARIDDTVLVCSGTLAVSGMLYEKRVRLSDTGPEIVCDYRITNTRVTPLPFLWKLHAAMAVKPGDMILCPAQHARPLDLEWSRCPTNQPFAWPRCAETAMDRIPPIDGTSEFLCLSGLRAGTMAWSDGTLEFRINFDPSVFPWCWYFASFGKFDGHYTAILEPCTSGQLSVAKAAARSECSVLQPGEQIRTTVTIYAGIVAGS